MSLKISYFSTGSCSIRKTTIGTTTAILKSSTNTPTILKKNKNKILAYFLLNIKPYK